MAKQRSASLISFAEPLGANQRVGSPPQRRLKEGRYGQRKRPLIKGAHDDRVVAGRLSNGKSLVGERLPMFKRASKGQL
jgi:hypothetical protein